MVMRRSPICEATNEFSRISWVERYEALREKTELARCQNSREVSEFCWNKKSKGMKGREGFVTCPAGVPL